MSVDSKMTAIADAVRTLRGISGTMGLDAMKTNIDGANEAVDAALAALTEKGVTVPDGAKVDGLAALIAAIESGGGGEWASGTFVLNVTSSTRESTVEHKLGTVPNFAICHMADNKSANSYTIGCCGFFNGYGFSVGSTSSYKYNAVYRETDITDTSLTTGLGAYKATDTSITFWCANGSYFSNDINYQWIVGVL